MTGIQTQDATAPYTPIAHGGHDIAAGAHFTIAANPGRSKIILVHEGATGKLRLGLGQTAVDGVGLPLGPGGDLNEPLACSVDILNTGTDPVHVSWVELGV